jgi:hypothetical protein
VAGIFHQRKSVLSLFIILTTLIVLGCNKNINNPDVSEDEVVGKWVLTKIIASYPFGTKELTPQEENSAAIIILNSDKTYQRNQNIQGQVTNDSGTWSVANGALTVTSASGTFTFPCHVNGKILQIATTKLDPDSGNTLPITLEFTKQ